MAEEKLYMVSERTMQRLLRVVELVEGMRGGGTASVRVPARGGITISVPPSSSHRVDGGQQASVVSNGASSLLIWIDVTGNTSGRQYISVQDADGNELDFRGRMLSIVWFSQNDGDLGDPTLGLPAFSRTAAWGQGVPWMASGGTNVLFFGDQYQDGSDPSGVTLLSDLNGGVIGGAPEGGFTMGMGHASPLTRGRFYWEMANFDTRFQIVIKVDFTQTRLVGPTHT